MNKRELKESIVIVIGAILCVLILGAFIFHFLEGWTYLDAFYFVTMTATTVGYGDFAPTSTLTKLITIIYSLSIVPFVLYAFTLVAKSQINHVYQKLHHIERKQQEHDQEIDQTERKIQRQKSKIKEQEEELDDQQKEIRKQLREMREHEKELEEHDKELETQKRRIRKQDQINKEQETEIEEHDKELEVVEEVMEEALKK